ncbi:transposable element Tcb1 transposase [Trichonephila clavipes]|nr:transposable element Tcb1 transposase [Trichonephila clavipes]
MQWLLGAIFQQDNDRPHTARVFTRLSPQCYYPSLACPIPRFVSNRAFMGSFGTVSWASHEFERTRGKVTTNMERNVSKHHIELVCLNAQSYCIVNSCKEGVQQERGASFSIFVRGGKATRAGPAGDSSRERVIGVTTDIPFTHMMSGVSYPKGDKDRTPFQKIFNGPAGRGKTFVIKLLMEIYNRYTDNDGYCQSCKAAVAISETTVHAALKISLSRLLPLHSETAEQ